MQDKKKSKDSKGHKPGKARGKFGNSSRLNIMVMRGVGKTWRFTLSSHLLFFALLFLVLFILGSLFIINDYFDRCHVNERLSKQLEAAGSETQSIKRALHRVERQLAVFQGHLRDTEARESSPQGNVNIDSDKKESIDVEEKNQVLPGDEIPSQEPRALVTDLKTIKDGAKLTANFRLENKLKTGGPLKGYIHMIALGKDSDGPQLWTYPKVALKDGLPINYKLGWHFVIKRFKVIQGEFFFDSESVSPSFIKVIVYDNNGELICEKMFEVK